MISRLLRKFQKQIDQAHVAQMLLQSLERNFGSYVPWTTYSLKPNDLATILNDLVINQRTHMLEFGSGVSTIYAAMLIEVNQLPCKITAIEHDEKWLEIMKHSLKVKGLLEQVDFIFVPLKEQDSTLGKIKWYDQDLLRKQSFEPFDAILVDGPPANNRPNRYPALPFLKERNLLKDSHIIYLDDCNRDTEKKIMSAWSEEYKLNFKTFSSSIFFHVSDEDHFFKPMPV